MANPYRHDDASQPAGTRKGKELPDSARPIAPGSIDSDKLLAPICDVHFRLIPIKAGGFRLHMSWTRQLSATKKKMATDRIQADALHIGQFLLEFSNILEDHRMDVISLKQTVFGRLATVTILASLAMQPTISSKDGEEPAVL